MGLLIFFPSDAATCALLPDADLKPKDRRVTKASAHRPYQAAKQR